MEKDLQAKMKFYRINQSEYERICQLLERPPRGVEWALFSALWSEHCSYKSSRVHLKKLFNKSPRVLQAFGENAGVVDLGEGERVAFKMESHNHPSYIEPYQGAATGVGGILRDIFTMGARPIALANYLCFGEAGAERMKYLVDGVVRGIGGYGNCVGVPNVTGQTEFHPSYNGNILVNAFALGYFAPGEPISLSKAKGAGNYVVYVGAKTGRDGVHGASMASESFDEDSEAKKPNVQIGDPFFEKCLIESCLEVISQNLVEAIQDMGAAGLTSSSFEMASKGQVGFVIDLDKVPIRDSSITPEEILLSESQERMLLVCRPEKFAVLQKVFHRWNLDASVIGEVVSERVVKIRWRGEELTAIDPDLLVENAPMYQRPYKEWTPTNRVQPKDLAAFAGGFSAYLKTALNHVTGTSRDWIYRQYDQRVGGNTEFDCEQPAGVVRLPHSRRRLGIALGCRPHVMRFDAHAGGIDSVAFPALQLAVLGFEPVAMTDCLNFGNPEKEKIMSEFVAAIGGMSDMAREVGAPIISGNVSFYNETLGKNITSTPATGLVGLREETRMPLPESRFAGPGETVVAVRCPQLTLSAENHGEYGTGQLDVKKLAVFIQGVRETVLEARPTSAQAVGKFGRAYTLAKMALGGTGAKIADPGVAGQTVLYEVLLTFKDLGKAKKTLEEKFAGFEWRTIGETGGAELDLNGEKISLNDLKSWYSSGWRQALT